MTYFLAPSLVQLRSEVNIRWPDRDKGSDGWIGDTAHTARKSDHNPDWFAGGIVRAIDIDKDGIDVNRLLNSIVGAPRVAYIIWQGRIWQNPAVYENGGWQTYGGANGHFAHIHISARRGYEYIGDPWGVLDGMPVTNPIGGGGTLPDAPDITPPTPIEGDWLDMATQQDVIDAVAAALAARDAQRAVIFFKGPGDKVYEHNPATGLTYQVLNGEDLADRKTILTRLGTPWRNWSNASGTWDVANPEAFGKIVA